MNNDTLIGSDMILDNTKAYGREIISSVFPSPIDGMKKVHRRILWSLRDKSGKISGDELVSKTRRFHPHGEMSIYDAATKLGQAYRQQFPLLDILGDDGTYGGDKPSSSRYNEFKLSDFTKDVFFRNINLNTLPMTSTEDLSGHEPDYLIPKIPTALLLASNAVGFGFKSTTIPLHFNNICDLVKKFIETPDRKTWKPNPKLLLMYPPIWNRLINEEELVKLYSSGTFETPIRLEGRYEILDRRTVMIYTLAYGIDFASVRKNFIFAMRNKSSWVASYKCSEKSLSDHHSFAKFKITTKNPNILHVIDLLKTTLGITGAVHPVNNFTFRDTLVNYDPANVIRAWYKERFKSILNDKRYVQAKLKDDLIVMEAYLVIANHVDEVIDFIKSHDVEAIMKFLSERFGLSPYQSKHLIRARLLSLSKRNREDTEKEFKRLTEEYHAFVDTFTKIDDEIYEAVEKLQTKYKVNKTYRGWPDTYKGVMYVEGHGHVKFKNKDDKDRLMKIFNGKVIRVYPKTSSFLFTLGRNLKIASFNELHYSSSCSTFIDFKHNRNLFVFKKRGYLLKSKSKIARLGSSHITNWVSSKPYVIYKDGSIKKMELNGISMKDVLYMFDAGSIESVLIVTYSTREKGKLTFHHGSSIRINNSTIVVGTIPVNVNEAYLNLPGIAKFGHSVIRVSDKLKNGRVTVGLKRAIR